MESVDVSVKWPFKWCLVGSSGSGKTMFSLNLIKNIHRLVDMTPSKIVIIFKEYQDIYDEFKKYFPTELIHEEEADIEYITKDNKERMLLICDDLYFSKKLDDIAEQFLIKGRHRNTSWLVLTQSIFNRPALVNISRNCNHITLFKTVRLNEPHIFFSQLRPRGSKILQKIFAKATDSSFSYLDIDLSQTCPDKYRYKANLFDKFVEVYLIMNENTFKKMFLVSEADLKESKNGNFKGENFKFSVENKDICSNGVNISVKPVKKRNTANKTRGDDGQEGQIKGENQPFINGENGVVNEENEERDALPEIQPPITETEPPSKQLVDQVNEQSAEPNTATEQVGEQLTEPTEPANEAESGNLKRKPLSLNPNFLLEKSKTFSPYPFLKPNNRKRMISVEEVKDDPVIEAKEDEIKDGEVKENDVRSGAEEVNQLPKDQWMHGINSKLSDRKVQFKRKRNSVAYRIAPDDVKNSLIKPSDFNFLSPKDSEKYSWKMPDEKYHKKFKRNLNNDLRKENNKRFRLY